MNNDRELLQQALDVMLAAIKAGDWKVDGACDPDYVLEALRTRLSQCDRCGEVNPAEIHTCTPIDKWIKANTEHREWYICPKCSYQAPRFKDEWQGLTDEEITEAYAGGMHVLFGDANKGFARAIEAKLKEKNT